MLEMVITTPAELAVLADRVLALVEERHARTATVLALHGELGAGKTAFTKACAQVLGVSEPVTSPTFVLMRRYAIPAHSRFTHFVHIDAYRVESPAELAVIRLDEILQDPGNLVCIEWAERVGGLPADAVQVVFSRDETSAVPDVRVVTYGMVEGEG